MANRRFQVSNKAPKEQIPGLLAELVNREKNVETMRVIEKFLSEKAVMGSDAKVMAQCLVWLDGSARGEETRIKEIKAMLPDQDAEIKMGPEETEEKKGAESPAPEQPAAPADTAVGQVEIQKGEPVLQ